MLKASRLSYEMDTKECKRLEQGYELFGNFASSVRDTLKRSITQESETLEQDLGTIRHLSPRCNHLLQVVIRQGQVAHLWR